MSFKSLYTFRGRSPRREYAAILLMNVGLSMIMRVLPETPAGILALISFLTGFPIQIATAVRRCHDLGKPSWYLLLCAIPLVNVYVGVRLLFSKGDAGVNQFGPPTLPVQNTNTTGVPNDRKVG